MTLGELQHSFCRGLTAANPEHDELAPFAAMRGFGVYRHAYRARLHEALGTAFEKTWSWLGDDRFAHAVDAYIDAHPPSSWTLDAFGDAFGRELRRLFPDDPEVAELADLEWALHNAFTGPHTPALDAATLAGVNWDRVRLLLAPTVRLLPVRTNVAAIWNAISESRDVPAAALLEEPAALLIWRQQLSPTFRTLEPDERGAITLALVGESFGTICGFVATHHADPVARAGELLAAWLRDGLLIGVSEPVSELSTG